VVEAVKGGDKSEEGQQRNARHDDTPRELQYKIIGAEAGREGGAINKE
jgi:hypothetical protein